MAIKSKLPWWIWLVPIAALAIAFFKMPYGYYVLSRWITSGASVYLAYSIYKPEEKLSAWVAAFVINAIVYNPIIPIHFTRDTWGAINLVSIILFASNWLSYSKQAIIQPKGSSHDSR